GRQLARGGGRGQLGCSWTQRRAARWRQDLSFLSCLSTIERRSRTANRGAAVRRRRLACGRRALKREREEDEPLGEGRVKSLPFGTVVIWCNCAAVMGACSGENDGSTGDGDSTMSPSGGMDSATGGETGGTAAGSGGLPSATGRAPTTGDESATG